MSIVRISLDSKTQQAETTSSLRPVVMPYKRAEDDDEEHSHEVIRIDELSALTAETMRFHVV
jgi:hypothetical protein